jgi:dienelactone hydrolase
METKSISYDFAGTEMIGYLALPDEPGPRPGVLVSHGGGQRMADMAAMMAKLGAMRDDPQAIRALGKAGLAVLLAQPQVDPTRIAAIGYCFGGTMSLELARAGVDLKAAIGFHSGLGTARPEDATNITAKVLVCIGADDPMIPVEQRSAFEAEMRAGKVDWRMNLYGGAAHSFTNPNAGQMGMPGVEYHQLTDERSWQAMLDLFAEVGM